MPDERRAAMIELHERLASLETTTQNTNDLITAMDRKLFGNGSAGFVEKITDRVTSLENWKWYVVGAISVFGVLATAVEVYAHFMEGK